MPATKASAPSGTKIDGKDPGARRSAMAQAELDDLVDDVADEPRSRRPELHARGRATLRVRRRPSPVTVISSLLARTLRTRSITIVPAIRSCQPRRRLSTKIQRNPR